VVSLFKDRSAVSVFWLIIVCFGLHTQTLINPPQVVISPNDGFLFYLLRPLQHAEAYLVSLLYIVFIFLLALQLNFVLSVLRMYPRQSYTAALAFLLFSALLPAFNVISAALVACNFFIWILYGASKLYAAPNAKSSIYNFGLLNGLCVLLYYPSVPLILIAVIALAIIRPFRLNEWFVLFFGIITPAYFLITYFFLTGQLNLVRLQQVFNLIRLPVPPVLTIITWLVAALVALWGIFSVQNSLANVLIQVRKSWSVFLLAFIFFLPMVFLATGAYPFALLMAIVPASAYAGFALANNRNILPVVFFWALLGLSIYNNWFAKY
jgi:hypothetical protein